MKLIVIRHGETDLNKEERLQGSKGPNPSLNSDGRRMVADLRDSLLITPEIIYCSPLVRAIETAHILNERFVVKIIATPELVERDFGTLSGKLRNEIDQKIVEDDLEGHYDYRPFNGESVDDVTKRVEQFINKLRTNKEEVVMLITHRGVIRILYDLYPETISSESIMPASRHVFEV